MMSGMGTTPFSGMMGGGMSMIGGFILMTGMGMGRFGMGGIGGAGVGVMSPIAMVGNMRGRNMCTGGGGVGGICLWMGPSRLTGTGAGMGGMVAAGGAAGMGGSAAAGMGMGI